MKFPLCWIITESVFSSKLTVATNYGLSVEKRACALVKGHDRTYGEESMRGETGIGAS